MFGGTWTRTLLVASLGALALCAPAAVAVGTPARAVAFDALERQVLVELNAVRASHGLRPLRASAPLARAADVHSRDMGRRGFFAHTAPGGSAFWKRVKRFYPNAGYRTWTVGENLLWSSPTIEAERAVEMWMDSPGHRRNILDREWREIGISAIRVAGAPGVFEGRDVVILTTDFGIRR